MLLHIITQRNPSRSHDPNLILIHFGFIHIYSSVLVCIFWKSLLVFCSDEIPKLLLNQQNKRVGTIDIKASRFPLTEVHDWTWLKGQLSIQLALVPLAAWS